MEQEQASQNRRLLSGGVGEFTQNPNSQKFLNRALTIRGKSDTAKTHAKRLADEGYRYNASSKSLDGPDGRFFAVGKHNGVSITFAKFVEFLATRKAG